MKSFIIILLISIMSGSVWAKDLMIFDCVFDRYSDKNGLHVAIPFKSLFIIDKELSKTYVTSLVGTRETLFVLNEESEVATFVEINRIQNVITTSISFRTGEATNSRNISVGGDIVASQYYGKCEFSIKKVDEKKPHTKDESI